MEWVWWAQGWTLTLAAHPQAVDPHEAWLQYPPVKLPTRSSRMTCDRGECKMDVCFHQTKATPCPGGCMLAGTRLIDLEKGLISVELVDAETGATK